jgi:hypothetical protein
MIPNFATGVKHSALAANSIDWPKAANATAPNVGSRAATPAVD